MLEKLGLGAPHPRFLPMADTVAFPHSASDLVLDGRLLS